jgi:hypothetical protein
VRSIDEFSKLDLVEIKDGTPHCKIHGAMNKLTKGGIWRCFSAYSVDLKTGEMIERTCNASCIIDNSESRCKE